ncbi:MAG: hypothetical protein ACM31J_04995 [Nitrososphaerales archaeon]
MTYYYYEDDRFKGIIDEFILSSSGNESLRYTLKNIDVLASKLGISFYHMIFILIKRNIINSKKIIK